MRYLFKLSMMIFFAKSKHSADDFSIWIDLTQITNEQKTVIYATVIVLNGRMVQNGPTLKRLGERRNRSTEIILSCKDISDRDLIENRSALVIQGCRIGQGQGELTHIIVSKVSVVWVISSKNVIQHYKLMQIH